MTPKWRKKLLWLLIPGFGGPTVGSLVATELNGSIGKINFKHSLQEELGKFIKASGTNETKQEGQNDFSPVKLVSELAKDPNSIPLLMRGFATQVAKHIFDGSLFKDKKHTQQKQHFSNYLRGIKGKTQGIIQQKRKDKTRVKRNWVSDEERYLSSLEDFVTGKIDVASIGTYYTLKDHDFTTPKTWQGKNVFTFIGFLMSRWLSEAKAGNYVHHILPYGEKFQESTKELYGKKFKNINLPNRPDFYFPDFDTSKIKEFEDTINLFFGGSENSWLDTFLPNPTKNQELIKKQSTIKWVSSTNTPQTNLVLKYLSEGNGTQNGESGNGKHAWWSLFTSFWRPTLQKLGLNQNTCESSDKITEIKNLFLDLKKDPLKLFCISNSKESSNSVEFVIHTKGKNKTEKIVFWRDANGFNVLFPSTVTHAKQGEDINESFQQSKKQMVEEFKEYIKKNFSYLLLQYYLFINKECCKDGKSNGIPCCCKEIINSLVNLWKLNRELTELNEILKAWDIRERNNAFFKVVDYSQEANYLYKLGTVDANPPGFLKEVTKNTKLESISSSVSEHLKKVGDYFEKKSEGAQNQGKKSESVELKEKENEGSGEHADAKYWSFENGQKGKEECMKRQVAEFLLEKISTMDLLKKTLLLPFSFEKISILTQQGASASSGTDSSNNSLSKLEEVLKKDYNGFFNFASTTTRRKREAPSPQDSSQDKLIDMLQKAIKEELSVSHLKGVSDTLLHKLSSDNNGSSNGKTSTQSKSDNFEAIKNLVTLSNLSKQPLKTANTLERSQLRLLVTSLYLIEDSLKEYRELLKSIIKEQLFGGYAFSISWNKFCTQKDETNPIDPTKGQAGSSSSGGSNGGSSGGSQTQSFWHPIDPSSTSPKPPAPAGGNGTKEWEKSKLDPRKCIRTPDRYSISTIKTASAVTETSSSPAQTNSNIQLMGYKGSLTRGSQLQLPGDLYEKVVAFLLKEGHISWSKIISQIDLIKSNRQLYSFIQQLSKINSSLGEIFKLPDYRNLKEDMDESKRAEMLEWFGLTKRKELLKTFIQQNITKGANGATQLTTVSSSAQSSSSESSNPKDKKAFSGLMWDTTTNETGDKKYVFTTKDPNEGSAAIYLIQYSANDVQSKENFAKFLKDKLTPDALIKDIVKKAQDPGLQAKAINHYLMRGSYAGGKVFNLTSDDYYLKDQFSSIIL